MASSSGNTFRIMALEKNLINQIMIMNNNLSLSLILFYSFLTIHCASSSYMPALSTYETEPLGFQYSDSTIKEAFRQNPQIELPVKLAVYDVGFESLSISDSLKKFNEIRSITHISPAMVEGGNYYSRLSNPWYHSYSPPPTTDPKKLRTIAARSHSDLILFFGTGHNIATDSNLLGVTYFALVPMLFMKGSTLEVTSYLDVHLIDVRNGYIYTSFRAKAKSYDRFVKINHEKDIDELKQRNIASLTNKLLEELSRTFNTNEFLTQNQ